MGKNSGKNLSLWFNGVEEAVDQVSFDSDYEELESTDSSTVSPTSEFLMNRTKRTISIDAILREDYGTEIATGTLTLDVKYRVTAKDTVLAAYEIGEIFTSDGTEVMSATDKVQPLGAEMFGKNMARSIGGSSVPVVSLSYNRTYGEFEATDTDTTGDATEFEAGRVKTVSTIEMIMYSEDADLLITDPASQAIILTFASGYTLTGNATFKKKGIITIAKGDLTKVTYDVTWNGAIVSTILTELSLGTSKACEIIYEEGTTNKEQTGNVILFTESISGDVSSVITVNYTGNWVGAVTEDELT